MRVVVNTSYQGHSAQICTKQIAPKLAEAGNKVVYNDWGNYQNYDLALFVSPDSEVEKAQKTNPNIITGIIDPKTGERRRIKEAELADFLAVTSLEQRDFFLRYNRNIIIYYHFPEIREVSKDHAPKKKIIIGYHGNKIHLNCMIDLSRALDELADKYNIEFWTMYNIKKLGEWEKNLPKKCPVKHIQWSKENYYTYLSQCDIGVVPAKISINLSRGKLASRFLSSFLFFSNWARYNKDDYLVRYKYSTNAGRVYPFSQFHIPVVAEFMPSYCQVIQNKYSGFLVYSREGWYDALEKLIINPDLRNKMSRNIKNFIDNNCSPNINFKNFLKFINTLKKRKNDNSSLL